jgi:PAS domain S-box-containing protein
VLGTFATYYREPRSPTPQEHNVIEQLTHLASIAIECAQVDEVLREQASLLNLTRDSIFVRGMDDVITYWNRGAEELYGWTAEQAVCRVSHELTGTVFPAPIDEIRAELLRTGRWEGELVQTKADGTRVVVASRWSLQRDERQRPVAILETNNDVTERKRAKAALREAQAALAHVTRVMTVAEIASSIGHEVNQPLAAIVMTGDACRRWLAAEPPKLAEAREAIQHIISDGKRASQVIDRIRTLLQKGELEKKALNVNELMREALTLTRGELARHQIAIQTDLREGLPHVVGDRVQLQQVLVNLMLNSADAMSAIADGRRLLTLRSRTNDDGGILVEVADTGVGLAAGSSDKIFDAFYSTKPHGLGMGLSISRSIIEAHGGRLWATGNDGPGATLHFTLSPAS